VFRDAGSAGSSPNRLSMNHTLPRLFAIAGGQWQILAAIYHARISEQDTEGPAPTPRSVPGAWPRRCSPGFFHVVRDRAVPPPAGESALGNHRHPPPCSITVTKPSRGFPTARRRRPLPGVVTISWCFVLIRCWFHRYLRGASWPQPPGSSSSSACPSRAGRPLRLALEPRRWWLWCAAVSLRSVPRRRLSRRAAPFNTNDRKTLNPLGRAWW